ncbi:MAG TPA: transcription elongation factor [Polyangia bacterium]|nr:transcription elongation factor [Polyangia bacterium]
MPTKSTVKKAKRDLSAGKRSSTAAGEFVREEMDHIRKGKHGARSPKQAIAIGLSKARRAGVPLKPPARGRTSARTRREATLAYETGQGRRKPRPPSTKRKRASTRALKRESRATASRRVLAAQNRSAKARRNRASRASAKKRAAGMKGMHRRSASAKRRSASRKSR